MKSDIQLCWDWYCSPSVPAAFQGTCATRDVFQGRLDTMNQECRKGVRNEDDSALVTAIIGEIGNNCFDHNLGQWRDVPGCCFCYGQSNAMLWAVIADRGQGLLGSLGRVASDITDDESALEAAFQRRLSGRSPERRGNGLKFVRSIINGNTQRGLFFSSGKAHRLFGGLGSTAQEKLDGAAAGGSGTFAIIVWSMTS